MDGISAAASVAGVAAAGVQLSKSLYDLFIAVKASGKEIQDIANNISLLSMVLEELDGVLAQDQLHFKPQLQQAAEAIVLRCASIFKDIRKHTGVDQGLKGKRFSEKITWYFKRERVKPLRVTLESLKSTLNILLHVVQLAKTTKNVEEYPGVKPIGSWYVRKERRGLVCLVIDNRHTTEKLRELENQALQPSVDSSTNEQPVSFAEIFPLSTTSASNRQRDGSPERKFIVSFRPRSPGDNGPGQYDLGRSKFVSSPKSIYDAQPVKASSSPKNQTYDDGSLYTEDKLFDGPASQQWANPTSISHTARIPTTKARSMSEQSTSQLIWDIIPHQKADEALGSAPNVAGSIILEAKAEETVDTLMRHWTYIDPKYFSDDDQSSISSFEASNSFPIYVDNLPRRSEDQCNARIEEPFYLRSPPGGRKSRAKERRSSVQEFNKRLNSELEDKANHPPSFLAGPKSEHKRKGNEPLPSQKDQRFDLDEKGKGAQSNLGEPPQKAQIPSSPAPPYGYSESIQCPHCCTIAPPTPGGTRPPGQQPYTWSPSATIPTGSGSTERDLDAIERLLKLIGHAHLQSESPEAQYRQTEETRRPKPAVAEAQHPTASTANLERHSQQQSIIATEPVTLKDCLGRKFIFPIQTCRTWPKMESLIRRSFSRLDFMNSKVVNGEYDILSPKGEIILPEIWDAVIQPGWVVELRFLPFQEVEQEKEAGLTTTPRAAPVARSGSPAARKNSRSRVTSDIQTSKTQRRYSLRTWLGGRVTAPSEDQSVNRVKTSMS